MVKDELNEIYERLKRRDESYDKAAGNLDFLINSGLLIFILSIIPIFPVLLAIIFNIDLLISMSILGFLGILLMVLGRTEKNRRIIPPELIITEKQFIKVHEALENLDTHLQNGDDFSRMEAMKILQEIEKKLSEPNLRSYEFWGVLIKDYNENLSLFKRNLNERLFPAIKKGEQQFIKLAYSITEDFAEFLINPSYIRLIDLNTSLSNLPTVVNEKEPKIPILQKRPIIKHIIIIVFFILVSYSAFYLGPKYLHISPDISYTTAWMIFATLTAGYMALARTQV